MVPGPTVDVQLGMVAGAALVPRRVKELVCSECGAAGACVQCTWGHCLVAFHPSCIPDPALAAPTQPLAGLAAGKDGLTWYKACPAHHLVLRAALVTASAALDDLCGSGGSGGGASSEGGGGEGAEEEAEEGGGGEEGGEEGGGGGGGGAASAGAPAGGAQKAPRGLRWWRGRPWGGQPDPSRHDAWEDGCRSGDAELSLTPEEAAAGAAKKYGQQQAFQRAVVAPFFRELTAADANTLTRFIEGGAPGFDVASFSAGGGGDAARGGEDEVPLHAAARDVVMQGEGELVARAPPPAHAHAAALLAVSGGGCAAVKWGGDGELRAWAPAGAAACGAAFRSRGAAEPLGLAVGGTAALSLEALLAARAGTASSDAAPPADVGSLLFSVPATRVELASAADDVTPALVAAGGALRDARAATALRAMQLLARVQLAPPTEVAAAFQKVLAGAGLLLEPSLVRVLAGYWPLPGGGGERRVLLAAPAPAALDAAGLAAPWQGPVAAIAPAPPAGGAPAPTSAGLRLLRLAALGRHPGVEAALVCAAGDVTVWRAVGARVCAGAGDVAPGARAGGAAARGTAPSWALAVEGRGGGGGGGGGCGTAPAPEPVYPVCAVCFHDAPLDEAPLTRCPYCGMHVHRFCYGVGVLDDEVPCDACAYLLACEAGGSGAPREPACSLCGAPSGALKRTTAGGWVHLNPCAMWAPRAWIADLEAMGPVDVGTVPGENSHLRARRVGALPQLRALLGFDGEEAGAAEAARDALPPPLPTVVAHAEAWLGAFRTPAAALPVALLRPLRPPPRAAAAEAAHLASHRPRPPPPPPPRGDEARGRRASATAASASPRTPLAPAHPTCALCGVPTRAEFLVACAGGGARCARAPVHPACAWLAGWHFSVAHAGEGDSFLYAGGGAGAVRELRCGACAPRGRDARAQAALRAANWHFKRDSAARAEGRRAVEEAVRGAAAAGGRGRGMASARAGAGAGEGEGEGERAPPPRPQPPTTTDAARVKKRRRCAPPAPPPPADAWGGQQCGFRLRFRVPAYDRLRLVFKAHAVPGAQGLRCLGGGAGGGAPCSPLLAAPAAGEEGKPRLPGITAAEVVGPATEGGARKLRLRLLVKAAPAPGTEGVSQPPAPAPAAAEPPAAPAAAGAEELSLSAEP
jgi:hypothetical protein